VGVYHDLIKSQSIILVMKHFFKNKFVALKSDFYHPGPSDGSSGSSSNLDGINNNYFLD